MPKRSAPESEGRMKTLLRNLLIGSLLLFAFVLEFPFPWMAEGKGEVKSGLAILSFFTEKGGDPGRGAICPICKRVSQKGDILLSAQNIMTRLLHHKIEAIGDFQALPLEKVEEALSHWRRKDFEEKLLASSLRLGKELNVDFLFIGVIFRFEERIGSALGVERPASVSFDLHLFRLKDEKMVWEGKFEETQRPLSEDLLRIGSFLKRRAHWLTAEELATAGMDEMLRKLPGSKELGETP
jgi:hypothetical protein